MSIDLVPQPAVTGRAFDHARVQSLVGELLEAFGEDPNREGLRDTPRRVADAWRERLCYDPGRTGTVFDSETLTVGGSELVIVNGIVLSSTCEHHLHPMRLVATVGYRPADCVVGLSKIPRIAERHAHRLQLQERIARGIADDLMATARTKDVGVVIRGEHLCMTQRGVRADQARSNSVLLHGCFDEDPHAARWLRDAAREAAA
ncbi:GTP cyclohydrolase I [Kitasatospora sp. NPDC059327]|uniref:GTP cyclohydrolase I n=1 Tax=Kitasatospora sp. NPDC059327 TaxID=3346803 RepID=UPI0036978503